jgi:hypothetical protein
MREDELKDFIIENFFELYSRVDYLACKSDTVESFLKRVDFVSYAMNRRLYFLVEELKREFPLESLDLINNVVYSLGVMNLIRSELLCNESNMN